MAFPSTTATTSLVDTSPIFQIPGIGRRTAKLLYDAGVETVGSFTRLPDLLLEATFGPSLPALRREALHSLERSSKREFTDLLRRMARQLAL